MVLAPLPRLALIDQKITPALVSFDSLSGISRVDHLVCLTDRLLALRISWGVGEEIGVGAELPFSLGVDGVEEVCEYQACCCGALSAVLSYGIVSWGGRGHVVAFVLLADARFLSAPGTHAADDSGICRWLCDWLSGDGDA